METTFTITCPQCGAPTAKTAKVCEYCKAEFFISAPAPANAVVYVNCDSDLRTDGKTPNVISRHHDVQKIAHGGDNGGADASDDTDIDEAQEDMFTQAQSTNSTTPKNESWESVHAWLLKFRKPVIISTVALGVIIAIWWGVSSHIEAEKAAARVKAEQAQAEATAKAEREAQELKERMRVENEAALAKKRAKDEAEAVRLRAEKKAAAEEAIAKRARLLKLVDEKVNAEINRALDPAKVAEELHLPYPLLSSGKTETEALHDAAEQIRQAVGKRIQPINYDELRARAEKDFVMYKRGDLIRVEWIAGVRRSPLTGRLEAVGADMFKLDGAWILSRDIDPELWEKISKEAHRVAVDKIVKRESVTYNERVISVEYELRDSVTTQVMLANGYYPMRAQGKRQILGWISGEEVLQRELTRRRAELLPAIRAKIEMEILGALDSTPIGELEPQPTLSGDDLCDRGAASSQRGDHQQAIRYFITGAQAGHALCQYNLGVIYFFGKGTAKDYSESARWFRKAAEQDIPEAQFNLAMFYYDGTGVEKSYSEAIKWLRKSARLGDKKARSTLQKLGENP